MKREVVEAVDGQSIITESGEKICIGNHAFDVGESVWVDGRYAFGNDRRSAAPVVNDIGDGTTRPLFVVGGEGYSIDALSFQIFDAGSLNITEVAIQGIDTDYVMQLFAYDGAGKVFAFAGNRHVQVDLEIQISDYYIYRYTDNGVERFTVPLSTGALVDMYINDAGNVVTRFFKGSVTYSRYYDNDGTLQTKTSGAVAFVEYENGTLSITSDYTSSVLTECDNVFTKMDSMGDEFYKNLIVTAVNAGSMAKALEAAKLNYSGFVASGGYYTIAEQSVTKKGSGVFTVSPTISFVEFNSRQIGLSIGGTFKLSLDNYVKESTNSDVPVGTEYGGWIGTGQIGAYHKYPFIVGNILNDVSENIESGSVNGSSNSYSLKYSSSIVKDYNFGVADYNVTGYVPSDPSTKVGGQSVSTSRTQIVKDVASQDATIYSYTYSRDIGSGYAAKTVASSDGTYQLSLVKDKVSVDVTDIMANYGTNQYHEAAICDIDSTSAILLPCFDGNGDSNYPQLIRIDKLKGTASVIDKYALGSFNSRMPLISNSNVGDLTTLLSQKYSG